MSGTFSIISFLYLFKSNVHSVFVNAEKIDSIYGNSVKVIITLRNESSDGLELTNLKLLKNGTQIKDNGYNYESEHNTNILSSLTIPVAEYLPNQFKTMEQEQKSPSSTFKEKVLLQKIGMPEKFSYWIDKNQIPDTLEITTNKRLRLFSKTKRYSFF